MEFWNKLTTTQKIILGLAVLALLIVLVMWMCKKNEKMVVSPSGMKYDDQPNPKHELPESMYEGMMHETSTMDETDLPEDNTDTAYLVLFYADWCPHCKNMLSEWDNFSQKMNGYKGINIMKIEEKEAPELVQKHNVQGFPMVKLCLKGLDDNDAINYNGNRTATDLEQFLLDNY